jgi:phosphinothricin acetyltransferase
MEISISRMSPADREAMVGVYMDGVAAGDKVMDADNPRELDFAGGIVARSADRVVGWAAVSPIKEARAPPGVARVSVYVAPGFRRKGIGRTLLNAAIDLSGRIGITTLLSRVIPGNIPGLMLHKKCGFKAIGMIQQAGQVRGRWQDAVLLRLSCA